MDFHQKLCETLPWSFEWILYSWSLLFFIQGARGECCGKMLNKGNKYLCCRDKISKTAILYHKNQNLRCCKEKSYNKKTHECLKNGPIPKGFRTCNEEPYRIASHICCNKQIYEKTNVYECHDANRVPKGHRWCRAGKYLLRLFSLYTSIDVSKTVSVWPQHMLYFPVFWSNCI